VVTGGASGIGRATALLLARRGAKVFVGDVNRATGAAIEAEAGEEGLAIAYRPLDVTKPDSIEAFVDGVHAEVGCLDGLVNSAGWDKLEPFLANSQEFWDRIIAINLMGVIQLTRRILDPMVAAKRGRIVFVSSDAGRVGSMNEVVYSAAKGGQIAFTKSLAREMARYGINVNCICPGPTDTPLMRAQVGENSAKIIDGMLRAIPFRRLGTPEDMAGPISFFLEDRAAYITGQVLSVSGGLTMVD
jgi:2-hydroxycyclohexanecarboxyl-CoA dehydrogenase